MKRLANVSRPVRRMVPPSVVRTEPGTNPRDDLSRADWRFLLPRLRYASALFLGVPTEPVLRVLAGMAERVVVAARDGRALAGLRSEGRARGREDLRLVAADVGRRLPFEDRTFDLIVACGGDDATRLVRAGSCLAELDRLLRRDGCVYIETERPGDALRVRDRFARAAAYGFAEPRILWPARRKGRLRLAVALGDHAAARYCFDHVLSGISRRGRVLQRIGRGLARVGVLSYVAPRRIVLLERRTREEHGGRGRSSYWEAQLEAAGVDAKGGRSAFYARGDHNSNKATILVFGGSDEPEIVVKIPRSPLYNDRLEHEHRCLSLLHERRVVEPGTYPQPLFLGYHHGLAVHGQTMLRGTSFRNRTTCRADCPHAGRAIEWITRLGEASAERTAAESTEFPERLTEQFARFRRAYRITAAEEAFLADRIAALGRVDAALPRVVQHGDAGTWNIVIGADGRPGFLDWEDGEPRGMPLWDLFSFIQSYAIWIGRVQGKRDDAAAYAGYCFEPTPLAALQAAAVARYCARVGVDRALVEPLYYTCWLNRALRVAAWTEGPTEDTAYFRLLRLAIRHRSSRGLAWLFEA